MVEPLGKPRRYAYRTCGGRKGPRLSCVKTKQLPLGGPVDRYFKRQSHQLLGGELRRIFAVNNRSDDDAPQRPLSREHLLQATRVHEDVFDRSIDVQILRLRRKLERDPSAPRVIQTKRGIGYVFAVPVERV